MVRSFRDGATWMQRCSPRTRLGTDRRAGPRARVEGVNLVNFPFGKSYEIDETDIPPPPRARAHVEVTTLATFDGRRRRLSRLGTAGSHPLFRWFEHGKNRVKVLPCERCALPL